MDTRLARLFLKFRRHKKAVLISLIGGGLITASLVIACITLIIPAKKWQGITGAVTDSASALLIPFSETSDSGKNLLESSLLWVASTYIEATFHESNPRNYHAVLTCIASLGGPTPSAVIETVKSRIPNDRISQALDMTLDGLKTTESEAKNSRSSCINWMINS